MPEVIPDEGIVVIIGSMTAGLTPAEIKSGYESNADTNAFTDAEKNKLGTVEENAAADMSDAEIKVAYENNANTNAYTDAEKTKVAGLESSKFLGTYLTLVALQTAHPAPVAGSYGHVDAGAGNEVEVYIWDDDDDEFVQQLGASSAETAATIKTKYESNPDTNAYTDSEKTKLAGVEANATGDQTAPEIKTLYESNANTNAYTDAEKTKLAGLESSKFLGTYLTLVALQTAHPAPVPGSYGHVDAGVGNEVEVYIWDDDDDEFVRQLGASSAETAASIKTKYESNADTNAYTDAEKTKLGNLYENNSFVDLTGTNETLALSHKDKAVRLANAADIDYNIPDNATVAYPVGGETTAVQYGAGRVTFVPAAGVTLLSADGNLTTRVQYSSATLMKMATNTWLIIGDLDA